MSERRKVVAIAHRGAKKFAPENTLSAYVKAIELGADFVEMDIQTTADGDLVIMHNRTVDGTTNGQGAVRELSTRQIRSLDAGARFSARFAGEKVPFFEEGLEACQGRIGVYIDVKDAAMERVLAALKKYDMIDDCVIYGGVEELRMAKRIEPRVRIMPELGEVLEICGGRLLANCSFRPDVLDSHYRRWDEAAVADAHAAGALVYVDIMGETDNHDDMARAVEMGVDGIQTDEIDVLLEFLRARGLHG